jgi:type IV pilus assembly protein PilC
MRRFDYIARSSQGQSLQGVVSAATPEDAARQLRGEGKFPVSVKEVIEAAEAMSQPIRFGGKRVKSTEVIHFAAQMAVMVDTGVSLTEALQSIIAQEPTPAFTEVLRTVLSDVQAGEPLSVAFSRHPKVFKPLFVNLVRASEVSGTLGPMLDRCATYLHNQRETRRKVVGALIYPAFLMVMSANVVIFLLTFVLPKFSSIYAGREQLLPAPTKVLLAITGGLQAHAKMVVGGILLGIALLVWFLRSAPGVSLRHRLAVSAPILGGMLRRNYLVRCLRTLSTLLSGGVPLLDAVGITKAVAGNRCYEAVWDQVGEAVQRGEQLSKPLERSPFVPRSVTQMVHAGERTGRLSEVLDRVCVFLERELEESIKRMTQMVEPLMLLIMGSIVGSIVIALLLPIFTMSRMMGH